MNRILLMAFFGGSSFFNHSTAILTQENVWNYYAIAETHCGGGDEGNERFYYYITNISKVSWCSKSCTANEDAMKTEVYNKLMNDELPYKNCSGPYMKGVTPETRRKGVRILPFNSYDEAVKTRDEWEAYYTKRSGNLGEVKKVTVSLTKDCSHCRK